MLKELPMNRAFGLFSAVFLILCGGAIAWASFLQPDESVPYPETIAFAEPLPLSTGTIKIEPYGPFLQDDIATEESALEAQTLPANALANQDVLEKCASLLAQGVVCMFVNAPHKMAGVPESDDVIQQHMIRREQARRAYDAQQNFEFGSENQNDFADLEPAAGLYDVTEQNIFSSRGNSPLPDNTINKPENLYTVAADDTVAQAAMRAAVDMVRNLSGTA